MVCLTDEFPWLTLLNTSDLPLCHVYTFSYQIIRYRLSNEGSLSVCSIVSRFGCTLTDLCSLTSCYYFLTCMLVYIFGPDGFFISVVYFVVFELFILSLENISFICLRLMANLCRNSVHDYFRFPNSPFFLISTCTWPRMDTIIFCYSPNSPFFRISTFTWP